MDSVEVNMSETLTLPSTRLLKCNVVLTLFGKQPTTVKALIDSGSSHSFISPKVMSDSQIHIAKTQCRRQNFSIFGATGTVNCQCCIAKASLNLGAWSGDHVFIIANPVKKHEMILGRDFLKHNNAHVNHANETLQLADETIDINTVQTIGSEWIDWEHQDELDSKPIRIECAVLSAQALDSTIHNPVIVTVAVDSTIKSNTQRLIKVQTQNRKNLNSELLLFEPTMPMPNSCLIGRSLHKNQDYIYCNVVNAGDSDINLSTGHVLGSMDEIEYANVEFDVQVSKFQQLDIDKVRELANKSDAVDSMNPQINAMIANNKLTPVERRMLLVVLSMHEPFFQWDLGKLGRTKLVEHNVPTGDSDPVRRKHYPIPSVAMDEVRKQTSQMLKDNVIRPSKSPWRSPVLLV